MLKTSQPEMAQIQMALEKSHRVSPFKILLYLFWGLILAKCCLVQWAILTYNAPIDGFIYIWIPSILFGGICTVVYMRVTLEEFRHSPLASRLIRAIWIACLASAIIFAYMGVGLKKFNPFILPGLFATMMGIGYYIHSVIDNRQILKIAAVGWWLGGIWLFNQLDTSSLAWLSGLILFFQVLPTAFLYREAIQRAKDLGFEEETGL